MFNVWVILILLSLIEALRGHSLLEGRVNQTEGDYQAEEQRLALQIITTDQLEGDDGSANLMAKASSESANGGKISFDDQYELMADQLRKPGGYNMNRQIPRRIVINLKANGSDNGEGTRLTIGFAQPEATEKQQREQQHQQQAPPRSFQQAVRSSTTPKPISSRQRQMREAVLWGVDRKGGVPAMVVEGEPQIDRKPIIKLMLNSEAVDQMKREASSRAGGPVTSDGGNLDGRFYGHPSTQRMLLTPGELDQVRTSEPEGGNVMNSKSNRYDNRDNKRRREIGSHKLSVDNNAVGDNENYDGRHSTANKLELEHPKREILEISPDRAGRRLRTRVGGRESGLVGEFSSMPNNDNNKSKPSAIINRIDMSGSGVSQNSNLNSANNQLEQQQQRRRKSADARQEQQVAERVARLMDQLKLYTTKEQLMRVARELEGNNGGGDSRPMNQQQQRQTADVRQANELTTNLDLLSVGAPQIGRSRERSASRPVYMMATTAASDQPNSVDLAMARNRVPAPIQYEELVDSLDTSASQSSPVDQPEGAEQSEEQARGRQVLGEFRERQLDLKDKLDPDSVEPEEKSLQLVGPAGESGEDEDDSRPAEGESTPNERSSSATGDEDDEYTSNSDLVRVMRNNEKIYNLDDYDEDADYIARNQKVYPDTIRPEPTATEADNEIRAMEQIIDELVEREKAEQAAAKSTTNKEQDGAEMPTINREA